jgi:hypothetical protein
VSNHLIVRENQVDLRVLYVLPGNWEDEHEGDKAKNTLLWVSSREMKE